MWTNCSRAKYARYAKGYASDLTELGSLCSHPVRAKVDAAHARRGRRLKMLVGKLGLDGHSNGAEQIAAAARDFGIEVVYEGIRLSPARIANTALEEGVHIVGLPIPRLDMALAENGRYRNEPSPPEGHSNAASAVSGARSRTAAARGPGRRGALALLPVADRVEWHADPGGEGSLGEAGAPTHAAGVGRGRIPCLRFVLGLVGRDLGLGGPLDAREVDARHQRLDDAVALAHEAPVRQKAYADQSHDAQSPADRPFGPR